MHALEEKFCFASVEVSADMFAFVALYKRILDLECQATKREHALLEFYRKLRVVSSVAFSALLGAFAKAKKVRKCREELDDAGE